MSEIKYKDVFCHTKISLLNETFLFMLTDFFFFLTDFQVATSIHECSDNFKTVFFKCKCVIFSFMNCFSVRSISKVHMCI